VIRYQLKESGALTLRVYNMLGEEVATLVSGWMQSGSHEVTFDGATLASGVYYYRLTASGILLTKKAILIK
jgi:hypothetical protein